MLSGRCFRRRECIAEMARRLEWSAEEIQELKRLVQQQIGLSRISRALKRAPSSIIAKAAEEKITLGSKV